ncbi:unnamed protein product [Sympodiomycopsis kandeliae]
MSAPNPQTNIVTSAAVMANADDNMILPSLQHDDDERKSYQDVDAEKSAHDSATIRSSDDDRPDEDIQAGVRTAEAITLTWSRPWLIAAYVAMWCVYFVNYMSNSITGNLSPFILSGFEEHSLIPVISVVTSIMAAATAMPVAKILNTWDRGNGFLVLAALATLGLILSACCTNIYTYCAAQVFSTVGFTGTIFAIDVITMDTSTLRDRGLAYAFTSSPNLIAAFAGPKASEGFYDFNWRWAYGAFAIIWPVVTIPLYGTLLYNKRKALASGVLKKKESSGDSLVQQAWKIFIDLDVVGLVLLAGGLALFLLPFTIAQSAANQWRSAHIIAMLVVGFVMLASFALYERFLAPKPFLPFHVLTSRSVIGACLLSATYQIAYYCWNSYFTSFLQVVYDTSVSQAGYINSAFDVVSGVWLLVVGFAIKKTNRFRWLLYGAIPLYLLGEGLLIHFRQPGHGLGYIIMCQIFMAFGGSTIIICEQVAVLSAANHNDAASALAMLGVFGWIGGALGDSISGAIWTHTFPQALQKYLPEETAADWETIYDDLDTQLSYPVGDPSRIAIGHAYADAQTWMVTAGTAFMALALIWMFVMRNIKLDSVKQVKGLLF